MKRALFRGGAMIFVQVIVSGASLLVLYRILLDDLGAKQVGTWAVVAAVVAVFRLADFGFSGSMVKVVAKHLACRELTEAAIAVETGVLFVAAVGGAILLVAYPAFAFGVSWWLPHAQLPPGFLPTMFLVVWLTMVASIPCAALDGALRYDLRGLVLLLNSVLQLTLAAVLVPRAGLLGLAAAQGVQWGITLLLGWILIGCQMHELRVIPRRFDIAIWRELAKYGLAFQSFTIAALVADPATKLLITYFGTVETVAYYDMANRLILQFRQLFISATQVLTAFAANLQEAAPARIRPVYLRAFTAFALASVIAFGGLGISVPLISYLWLGSAHGIFIKFATWLVVGAFVSTLGTPAFFTNLGTGALRDNIAAQLTVSLSNIVLGAIFGFGMGAAGVVIGAAAGSASGGVALILLFGRAHRISLAELFPSATTFVLAMASAALAAVFVFQGLCSRELGDFGAFLIALAGFTAVVLPCIWLHPFRKTVIGSMSKRTIGI